MSNRTSPRFLETVRNVVLGYKATVGSPVAISDISKIARIEPITLISSSLAGEKELYNILHGVLNIYAAYYLQAVGILSAELADVRILKILDKVNPDRDMRTLLTSGYHVLESINPTSALKTLSLEGSEFKLPTISTESIFDEGDAGVMSSSIERLETFEKLGSVVGKVVEVKFNVQDPDDKKARPSEVSIPVVVKLDNMVIPGEVVQRIATSTADDIRLGSRFKDAISGRIDFIKDFILCSDLIKQQKRTMIKDPTGAYTSLMKRINNSRMYSALSGNISLAGISSILVMSSEDEQIIQRTLGGKLSNTNVRKIVEDASSVMMIVVVDKEWERVSIYVRDTQGHSENSFSSFRNSTDSNNDQIGELLKQMSMGSSPQF